MVRLAALVALALCLLLDLVVSANAATPLYEICGLDASWNCPKNIDDVPEQVIRVCEACGNYWGNMPGFGFCCRCSEKIFGFCLQAVFGGK